MSATPCRLAISAKRSIGAGLPHRCTTTMARVREVMRRSTSSGSATSVSGSTSQNTGVPPHCRMGAADAKKVYDGTMTSVPGLTPAAKYALCSDAVPLFITRPYLRACMLAKASSNAANGPSPLAMVFTSRNA